MVTSTCFTRRLAMGAPAASEGAGFEEEDAEEDAETDLWWSEEDKPRCCCCCSGFGASRVRANGRRASVNSKRVMRVQQLWAARELRWDTLECTELSSELMTVKRVRRAGSKRAHCDKSAGVVTELECPAVRRVSNMQLLQWQICTCSPDFAHSSRDAAETRAVHSHRASSLVTTHTPLAVRS